MDTDSTAGGLPAILRVGPVAGALRTTTTLQEARRHDGETQSNPWASPAVQPPINADPRPVASNLVSNNPYRQQNGHEPQNSQTAWQEVKPPAPAQPPPPPPPVELPAVTTPSLELSQMSLSGRTPPRQASYETAEVLPVPPLRQPPLAPVSWPQPVEQSIPASNPWQEEHSTGQVLEESFTPAPGPPPKAPLSPAIPTYAPPPGPPPLLSESLIDHPIPANTSSVADGSARHSDRPDPISIPYGAVAHSTESVPETPGTRMRRQKNEHYQIKHVRWLDGPAMRSSPVLIQNANGPCPLLALVNALILSTPPNQETALIATLGTREQVSLGLLLDAVFDELMSDRRGDAAHHLPDVSELYAFLLALHTGMNVNPRFITPLSTPQGSFDGHSPGFDRVHLNQRAQNKPGCFEETKEMRLYSTFGIPLIHGWTTPRGTPAYDAFERSAQTFEDAQNIQFAEMELEDKLRTDGLNAQEQQTLQDIQTIKSFLNSWPTQLTQHGLEAISSSLNPGHIAILFRNDHFSTLCKDPRNGTLMTLVTDAGYSGHDEIVWESLVDINGAAAELFSGDFRTVSHQQDAGLNQDSSAGGREGGRTSQDRYHHRRPVSGQPEVSATSSTSEAPPPLPGPRPHQAATSNSTTTPDEAQRKAAEQEDHDLALALQLQEEEEDHQRQAEERRRREQQLSERFISTESPEGPRPTIPPRRGAGRTSPVTNIPITARPRPGGRPAVNRPADLNDPEAPPTYEQAANDRPYRPGDSAPAPVQGSPLTAYDALRRQQNAMSSSTTVNSVSSNGRRRSDGTRTNRRTSQAGYAPNGPGSSYSAGQSPLLQRATNAPRVQDAEERCSVM